MTNRPVATDLEQFIPATVELGLLTITIAIALGVPLGVVAAVRKGTAIDDSLGLLSLGGLSTPPFWIGLIALFLFTFVFQIAPSSGRLSPGALPPPHVTGLYTVDSLLAGDLSTFGDAMHHLVLPAAVLSVSLVGVLLRFTRSAVLEVISHDYITAAKAKGLSSRTVLVRYTLRAALGPIVTLSGLMFADLMTGAVLVETVFSYPGVGLYAARAGLSLDLAAVTGVCIFVSIVYVATNFVVDVLQALIDPRVRLG
jgi:peptide/nickel transport system permease protein